MKLLLDENLSFRLVEVLQRSYAGSQHVDSVGLRGQDDASIWSFAGREGFAIVSKDDDFRQLSVLHGTPPKVILLACGNAGNDAIADLLERAGAQIAAFDAAAEESLLILRAEVSTPRESP